MAPTLIYTLSLHDALPILPLHLGVVKGETLRCGYHGWAYDCSGKCVDVPYLGRERSEEHTSELQSRPHLVCRLLLEKKKLRARRSRKLFNNIIAFAWMHRH